MSVIRRLECPEHGAGIGGAYLQDGIIRCGQINGVKRCGKQLEDREYVPAADLRGAVQDNDRLVCALVQAGARLNEGDVAGARATITAAIDSPPAGGR